MLVHKEVEAKLTDVESGAMIFPGEGGEVPGLHTMLPEFYELHSLDLGSLLKLMNLFLSETQMLVVRKEFLILLLFFKLALNLIRLALHLVRVELEVLLPHPPVISPLEVLIVDVVLIELFLLLSSRRVFHFDILLFLLLCVVRALISKKCLFKLIVLFVFVFDGANLDDLREMILILGAAHQGEDHGP